MSAAEFEIERYEDEYGKRAEAMIAEKVKGDEITAAPKGPERGAKGVDIMAALSRASLTWKASGQPGRLPKRKKGKPARDVELSKANRPEIRFNVISDGLAGLPERRRDRVEVVHLPGRSTFAKLRLHPSTVWPSLSRQRRNRGSPEYVTCKVSVDGQSRPYTRALVLPDGLGSLDNRKAAVELDRRTQ